MKSKDRFVFDTNVLVSGVLIGDSKTSQAFRKARRIGEILLSVATAQELNEVLDRDKSKHYIPREERKRFLVAFIQAATFILVFRSREPKATRT